MDVNQLIAESKARFSHQSNKEYLKNKYKAKLIFGNQGGLWTASTELIGHLTSCHAKQLVLLDNYENPIKVDRLELLREATYVYNLVMNEWHLEYSSLESKR